MAGQPRKIRILALHGMGTSASIFKTQTAGFRNILGPNFEFVFVNAPTPCSPAPGTDVLFSNPTHFAWWTDPTVAAIRASHSVLEDHLKNKGPFDVVMGFSQGCSLIISYMLYHARERPGDALPFRGVVFICGGVPLPVLEDLGMEVSLRAKMVNDMTGMLLRNKTTALATMAANPELIQQGVGLWDNVDGLLHNPEVFPDENDVFGLDFTAMPKDLEIRIPTVHIFGAKDPRWPASVQLSYTCQIKERRVYDHGGGHDIPTTTEVSSAIAEMIRDLVDKIDR